MNEIKKIANWIKRSFEESDGKSSSKRKTAFSFVVMISYIVVRYVDNNNAIMAMQTLLGGVMAMLGIAAYQNIKTKSNDGQNQEEPK